MVQRYPALVVPAALLALLAAGCSDLGPLVRPKPQAQLSTMAIDFGTVVLNQTVTRTVVIANIGTAPLNVTPSVATPQFTLPAGSAAISIPPGGQHSIDVQFTPGQVGSYSGTLDLGSDSPSVGLAGNGAVQNVGAHITVAPGSVDFGVVLTGNSAPGAFQITSDGTAPAIVDVTANNSAVTVTSGGGPLTLNPGAMLSVQLQFSPAVGGAFADTVSTGPALPGVPLKATVTTVSFSRDVNPIFSDICVGCHGWWNQSTDATSYASLVNVPSPGYPGHIIVVPFQPANSVLYVKITTSPTKNGPFGLGMPSGGPPLPAANITTIRTWISEGARNN